MSIKFAYNQGEKKKERCVVGGEGSSSKTEEKRIPTCSFYDPALKTVCVATLPPGVTRVYFTYIPPGGEEEGKVGLGGGIGGVDQRPRRRGIRTASPCK